MAWADRVEQLCYDGETVTDRFDLGPNTLVVTSHRLLAFTPGNDGQQYRQVDPPNIDGVAVVTDRPVGYLLWALAAGVCGIVLSALAFAFDFASIVPSIEDAGLDGSTPGVSAATAPLKTLRTVFVILDIAILGGGLLAVGIAIISIGLYVRSTAGRSGQRTLVVTVAGGPDIELPMRDDHGDDHRRQEITQALEFDADRSTSDEQPTNDREQDQNETTSDFGERAKRVPPEERHETDTDTHTDDGSEATETEPL